MRGTPDVREWRTEGGASGARGRRPIVPSPDGPGARLPGFLYNTALLAGSPLLLGYLGYRLIWKGKSRDGLRQRLGAAPRLGPPPPGGRVWLHAVSAGEMVAAAPVARRLRELAPTAE